MTYINWRTINKTVEWMNERTSERMNEWIKLQFRTRCFHPRNRYRTIMNQKWLLGIQYQYSPKTIMHDANNDIKSEIYIIHDRSYENVKRTASRQYSSTEHLKWIAPWHTPLKENMAKIAKNCSWRKLSAEWNLLKPEGRVHTGCLVMPMTAGDSCRCWGSVHLTKTDSRCYYLIHLPFPSHVSKFIFKLRGINHANHACRSFFHAQKWK